MCLIAYATAIAHFKQRVPFYDISWEIEDAPPAATGAERATLWIRRNRGAILTVARQRRIDARAITGVILYESLVDIVPPQVSALTRFVGPGKVHYRQSHFSEGDPISKQVEDAGYLPRRTMEARMSILTTDKGAITYIGAIMAAERDVAKRYGRDISCDPALLATFYTAWDLRSEEADLRSHDHKLIQPNFVGVWVHNYDGFVRKNLPASSFCVSRT